MFRRKVYNADVVLSGKTAIVTGSSRGIGKYTAADLYRKGCKVIMACNCPSEAKSAIEELTSSVKGKSVSGGQLIFQYVDLSSLQSVRDFADKILSEEKEIHLLINNAGSICEKGVSSDDYELNMAINCLGPFLLTLLLLPRLLASTTQARIVNVASCIHKCVFKLDWNSLHKENPEKSRLANYALSKLAVVMLTKELARKLQGTNVSVYAVHPGHIYSDLTRSYASSLCPGVPWLYRRIGPIIFKTEPQGASTSLYCALEQKIATNSGLYWEDCKPKSVSKLAKDLNNTERMWDIGVELTKVGDSNPFLSIPEPEITRL